MHFFKMLVPDVPRTRYLKSSKHRSVTVFHQFLNVSMYAIWVKEGLALFMFLATDSVEAAFHVLFNKLTSVFYASFLLLIMNFVITLSK